MLDRRFAYIYLEDLDSTSLDSVIEKNGNLVMEEIDGELIIIHYKNCKNFTELFNSYPLSQIDKILEEEGEKYFIFDYGEVCWCRKESTKIKILKFIDEYLLKNSKNLNPKIEILIKLKVLVKKSINTNLSIIFDFTYSSAL